LCCRTFPPYPVEDLSSHADLSIAMFAIGEIVEGTQTGRDGATLIVSPPQLAVGAGEPALAEATVEVVRPGDRVRITNVCDAVLPDVRADDPSSTFPGTLGSLRPAGSGSLHRLGSVAVLSVCDWCAAGYAEPDELPDCFVDMDGPGASLSPWGSTANVVLRVVPTTGAPRVLSAGPGAGRAGAPGSGRARISGFSLLQVTSSTFHSPFSISMFTVP